MSLLSLLVDGGWLLLGMALWSEEFSTYGSVVSILFSTVGFLWLGLLLADIWSWLCFRWTARYIVPVADRHGSVSTRFVQKQLATLDQNFFSAKIDFDEYQHRRNQLTGE